MINHALKLVGVKLADFDDYYKEFHCVDLISIQVSIVNLIFTIFTY